MPYGATPAETARLDKDHWAGVVVGAIDQQLPIWDAKGLGCLFRATGEVSVFDGTGTTSQTLLEARLVEDLHLSPAEWRHVQIKYRLRRFGDGKPVSFDILVDGLRVTNGSTAGCLVKNHVALQCLSQNTPSQCGFDNFSLSYEPLNLERPSKEKTHRTDEYDRSTAP